MFAHSTTYFAALLTFVSLELGAANVCAQDWNESPLAYRGWLDSARQLVGRNHEQLFELLSPSRVEQVPADSADVLGQVFLLKAARFHYEGEPNQIISYLDTAIFHFNRGRDKSSLLRCLNNKASAMIALERHTEAIVLLDSVVGLASEYEEVGREIQSLNRLSSAYRQLSLYEEALARNQTALTLSLASDSASLGTLKITRGQLFLDLKDYAQARRYLDDQALNERKDGPFTPTDVLLRLARSKMFGEQDSTELSLAELDQAEMMANALGHQLYLQQINLNRASCFLLLEQPEAANDAMQRVFATLDTSRVNETLAAAYLVDGQLKHQQGRFLEAIAAFDDCIRVANNLGSWPILAECYDAYSEALKSSGDFESAYENLIQSTAIKDSISNLTLKRNAQGLEVRFRLKEMQHLNQVYQQEAELSTERANREELEKELWQVMFALIVVALLLTLALAAIVRARMLRRKAQEQLEVALASQEQERQRIAMAIHDSVLQEMQASLLLLQGASEAELPMATAKAATLSREAIQELRSISHELYPRKMEGQPLAEVIEAYLKRRRLSFPEVVFTAKVEESGSTEDQLNLSSYRFVQEAVQNSLKHNQQYLSEVFINIVMEGREVKLSVREIWKGPGAGVNTEQPYSLFRRAQELGGKLEHQTGRDYQQFQVVANHE